MEMDNNIIRSSCNFGDGRELRGKNVQIRLMGHCIICLRKVSTKWMGNSTDYEGTSPPPEIAPKSVVTTPGFLATFNQVWAVLYAKWKEKNTRAKDDGSIEEIGISLESVLETSCASTNVSFSRAPTICQQCCLKVLAVENLMKAVRQQVREINMLLEEGRNRQHGGLSDFENNLREEGLEENVIRATLQFVGIFGSSHFSEGEDSFLDLKGDEGNIVSVNIPDMMEMDFDEENSLISSQIGNDDNINFETERSDDEDDDGGPDYVKSEHQLEEDDEDDGSAEEMDLEDEDNRNDPDYEAEAAPIPKKPRNVKRSPKKCRDKKSGSGEQDETEATEELPCSCGKSFKTRRRLLDHMRKYKERHPDYGTLGRLQHPEEANEHHRKFPCSCGKSFATMRNRRNHIKKNKELHPEYKEGLMIEGRRRPVCELCGKRVEFSGLLQHYTDHLNGQAEWVLRCPNEQCGLMFVTTKTFNRHVHRVKTDECSRIWKEKCGHICDICGFQGNNMLVLKNHVRDNHENGGEKRLRCPISSCEKMFCVRQSVHEHMYEHRYRRITQQICDKCGKDLKIEEMEVHFKGEHGIVEVIGCGQCEMRFSGREEMVEHLYEHREVGICCDICGDAQEKFENYSDFREHYFGVHKIFPKRYKCGEGDCDKWFWRKETKEDHELRMHKESNVSMRYKKSLVRDREKNEVNKFECDVCNVKFVKEFSLKNHKIKVHGEDPFRCDICGETFNETRKFSRHRKEHAGIVFEKEWRCEVEGCGKVFTNKELWKRHKEVGHGAVKKHICELCGKGYCDASTLKDHHDIVHLGKRPWVCDMCGESFTASTTLKNHKMIHTGERPFACELCGQRFRQQEVLRTHLRGHEKKGPDFKPNGPMKQIRKRKV